MNRTAVGIVFAGAAVALIVLTLLLPSGNDSASIMFMLLALCFLLASVVFLPSNRPRV